ncbi:MAG: hypothetical protein ACLFWR_00370 [Acidimicrobiales bacterium]
MTAMQITRPRRSTWRGRFVRSWVLVAVALVVLPFLDSPAGAQSPEPAGFFDAVGECPADAAVLVAVLTDDPDPAKTRPVADMVRQLADRERAEVLVATASPELETVAPWGPVTVESADRVEGFLEAAAPSDGDEAPPLSLDTGLAGVGDALDERADELDDPATACRVVIVLSSGQVAAGAGERACEPGGPVDRLRDDSTALWITSPGPDQLGGGVAETFDSVVSGTGCGSAAAEPPGRYLPTDDVGPVAADLAHIVGRLRGGLVTAIDLAVCDGEPCDEGTRAVTFDPVLGRLSVTAVLPDDTAQLVVGLPRGIEFPVSDRAGGPIGAGSFTLESTWVTPRVVRLATEVSPTETDWPGEWTFTAVSSEVEETTDAGAAQLMIETVPGLSPRVVGSPQLVPGREVVLEVEVTDAEGGLVGPSSLTDRVGLVAVIESSGDELLRVPLESDESGSWRGLVELPDTLGVEGDREPVTVRLVLSADSSLGPLPDVVTTTQALVLDPSEWPSLSGAAVALRGEAGSVATGAVTVTAGDETDGCVWLQQGALDTGPEGSAPALADDARSALSCVVVPAGQTVDIPLTVDLGGLETGRYDGSAVIALSVSGSDTFDAVDVDVVLDVVAPVDTTRRALIAAAMSLIALVIPLLALWLLDWVKARFRPSRQAVATDVWVAVWSDGSIYRVDTDGSPLILSDDLCEAAELPRARHFDWRDLHFSVRNATSPFRPPVGTVASADAPVVASGGAVVDEDTVVGRVPMNLSSTWIFVLQPDATRDAAIDPSAPDFFAAYGRLVVIRSSLEAPPVDLSGLARQAQRLARTVRTARREDSASAQDMLDFVEANASMPRDLPRMGGYADDRGEDGPPHRALPQSDEAYDFSDLDGLYSADEEVLDTAGEEHLAEAEQWAEAERWEEIEAEEREALGEAGDRFEGEVGHARDEDETKPAAGLDDGSGDDADSGVDIGFGIVFEDRVNPSAFLEPDDLQPVAKPSTQPEPDDDRGDDEEDEDPSDAGDERPAGDSTLDWARRSRPSWPTPGRRDDS